MRCLPLLLCLAACSAERQPGSLFGSAEEDSDLVVDALLLVDQALPELFVRRSLAPDRPYDSEAAGVSDARVRILQGDRVFEYAADPDAPGRYLPPPDPPRVEPRTEYQLEVEVEVEGQRVWGRTTTPGRLRVRRAVLIDWETGEILRTLKSFAEAGDGVFEAPENQLLYPEGVLEIHLEAVEAKGYQAAIFNLERYPNKVDEDLDEFYEDDPDPSRNQSPPLEVREGILRWPWFAVYYTGRSIVKVYALDRNWFDYARTSADAQEQGGWGRRPGGRQLRAAPLLGGGRDGDLRLGVGGLGGLRGGAAGVTHRRSAHLRNWSRRRGSCGRSTRRSSATIGMPYSMTSRDARA